MHNYRMAVTEREVRNGCITMPDNYVKDHVIIYTRILRLVLRNVFYIWFYFAMLKFLFDNKKVNNQLSL